MTVGAVKSKVPCGSHSHCNLLLGNHTQYKAHTNILQGLFTLIFFIKLSPNFLHHQPLGMANFRSCQICFGNYQHNAAQEDNAVSSSWLQAKLQIALKWFQCHNCMAALLPITHREIPKAPVTNTQKKVCPLCYFKQVQLTSEDLLMCWARHMLKYFPELMPDTNLTHTEPSALLPCPPTLHHLLRCSELALIRCSCNTGTMVSTRIMLRNIVRSCSKCAHSPKHAWDWSHSYSLCFSMLETKIRISSCVCQRWRFLP